ncbi:MAG: 1-deoxy-D-xylulose-5-phosphate reductoisomerase [Fibrobacterota bacterium]
MKKVLLLGSSGSIGRSTEKCIRRAPDSFTLVGISVRSSVEKARDQIAEFSPQALAIGCDREAAGFTPPHDDIRIYYGEAGLSEITRELDYDILVNALVGSVGLRPTMEALKRGKTVALANKESLVVGGDILKETARKFGGRFLPVDSEHSAIFQCLQGENRKNVESMTVTASGGPFRTCPPQHFKNITVETALKHPTWAMGAKITIDSSTLMNKGFEVMEAHHLFDIPYDKIDVLVHPQSIIHSMVTFHDGSVMAQCGLPDMELPIQYALTYPDRAPIGGKRLSLAEIGTLTFEEPQRDLFPCLDLCISAGRAGGTYPAVLNAANEVAVQAFLDKQIHYTDIAPIIQNELDNHCSSPAESISQLTAVDTATRESVQRYIRKG